MNELLIEPSAENADPKDPNWIAAVDELRRALKRDFDVLPTPQAEVAGKKGVEAVTGIILALGSSGAISAALGAFNAWLKIGRQRSLKLRMKTGDEEKVVELSSNGLSPAEFESLIKKFGK